MFFIISGACEENFGVYANPVDSSCTTFIQCSWSEPYVRDCNPGLLFNPETKLCDFPSNVNCKVKPPKDQKPSKEVLSQGLKLTKPNHKSVFCLYLNK